MNQSDLEHINLFEICQQQSQCYLLIPPPRLPTFPQLFFPNSSSIITNFRQRSDLFFIILSIFISTCLILVLLGVKFKLRHRHRRTTDTNTVDGCASLSSLVPISYDCLTPSLTMTNNSNLSHNYPTNVYEEIRSPLDHHHHRCTLAHYQPFYYTYEPSSSVVCQNCLLETLHRKQQCLCHHLFQPIK